MMHFEWLANPVTLCAYMAIGLVCALMLYVSLKCEIGSARRIARQSAEAAKQSAEAAKELIAALTTELASMRDTLPVVEIVAPSGEGLNLTRRAAALRMVRRGEPVSTISAALRVPQNEIELLLKLQKLASQTEIRSA